MPLLRCGDLRHRITIRRKTTTTNPETGGLEESWSDLATSLPAAVISLNGRESVIGQVLQGISYFDLTVRFRSDILASDQIVWLTGGNRELNVHSAEDRLGTRQWTVIQASTLAPEGV